MRLFLVRHGETEENVAGVLMGHHHGVLTEKGKQQARETAETLKKYKFNHIYSSDLNRCVDTSELIKEFHPDTPLTFTKELRERNLGELQGKSKIGVNWEGLPGEGDNKKPDGGESLVQVRVRALDFIKLLYNQYPHGNILLISHNGWIKQVVANFTGIISKDINNAEVIEIEVGDGLTGKMINS